MGQLLGEQAYQLEFWRTGVTRINYRRFFDISDLVGVSVEDTEVLEATHARIFRMVQSGQVTGLRVDHIDGLHEPQAYLHRLQVGAGKGASREQAGKAIYVVVEKILGADEDLPQEWSVCGTTGYEFLDAVNRVFVEPRGYDSLRTKYKEFTGCESCFSDVVYEQKKKVIERLFVAELARLGRGLRALAQQDEQAGDISQDELMRAIVEVTACCPVYRTYVRDFDITARDRNYIARSLQDAERRSEGTSTCGLRFLGRVLLLDFPPSLPQNRKSAWLQFVMQWQQFTGQAMAKGFEDTALYTYNALLSLNEVGAHAEATGFCVSAFHRHNQSRLRRWRHALSATYTHDTKRSEDVRARINVLSELPDEWSKRLKRWSDWNRPRKQVVDGRLVPDSNEETHLYQTLLGAWPLRQAEVAEFKQRVLAYTVKAAREAKKNTSWTCVDEAYEAALTGFVEAILVEDGCRDFLPEFVELQKRIAFYGMLNALAQTLLKIASPGVPDFYQGTELWDFSLVDPDNRRAVDFTKRCNLLDDLKRREHEDTTRLVEELLHNWDDGRVKLYLTYRALRFRQANSELFDQGDYLPVYACGVRADNVVAFARRAGGSWALVAVPRLSTRLVPLSKLPLGSEVWGGDHLLVPVDAPVRWRNILTGETIECQNATRRLLFSAVFRTFPIALLSIGITGR
jgi:(1->4)-alpha-D-glucan 1-alpha-D-glucosylmutase